MPEILNFFPLSVYAEKLGFSTELREAMASAIEKDAATGAAMIKNKNATWTGDVNGHEYLHEREEFQPLFEAMTTHVYAYMKILGLNDGIFDLYFTRTWGTVQKREERVHFHCHEQSHISAVYYPRVPKDSGMLIFDMPNNPNEFLNGLIKERNIRNGVFRPSELLAQNMNLGVETDLLVIFPSKTNHATQSNPTGESRISIAADIVCTLKDSTGHEHFLPPFEKWRKY